MIGMTFKDGFIIGFALGGMVITVFVWFVLMNTYEQYRDDIEQEAIAKAKGET